MLTFSLCHTGFPRYMRLILTQKISLHWSNLQIKRVYIQLVISNKSVIGTFYKGIFLNAFTQNCRQRERIKQGVSVLGLLSKRRASQLNDLFKWVWFLTYIISLFGTRKHFLFSHTWSNFEQGFSISFFICLLLILKI